MPTNEGTNIDTTQQQLAAMFRDQLQDKPAGYTNIEGGSEGIVGDKEAPWLKTPPFAGVGDLLVAGLAVTVAGAVGAEYIALPEVECRQSRLLQVYFAYTMAVGGQLSIIPEVFDGERWCAETLVGATVTPFTPVGTRFVPGGFGSRPLLCTELRTAVLVAGTSFFSLMFDVSAATKFRLNVLDLTVNAGNLLAVKVGESV